MVIASAGNLPAMNSSGECDAPVDDVVGLEVVGAAVLVDARGVGGVIALYKIGVGAPPHEATARENKPNGAKISVRPIHPISGIFTHNGS